MHLMICDLGSSLTVAVMIFYRISTTSRPVH